MKLFTIIFLFSFLNVSYADHVDDLISNLSSSDSNVRESAAEELGGRQYIRQSRVIQALGNTLASDSNRYVRRDAANSLSRSRQSAAVTEIINALTTSTSSGKIVAAGPLRSVRDARSVAPLRQALASSNNNLREAAASSLRSYIRGRPEVYNDLLAVLKNDSNRYVRRDAASALRESNSPNLANDLNQIIRDGSVNKESIDLMERFNNADSLPLLISTLSNSNSDIREAAVGAMEGFGDTDVMIPLLSLYGTESNRYVKREIIKRLVKINHPSIVSVLEDVLKSDSHLKADAAAALATLGNSTHLSDLLGMLSSRTRSERVSAYVAIKAIMGRMGSDNPIQNLVRCLPVEEHLPYSQGTKSFALLMDILLTGGLMPVFTAEAIGGKVKNVKQLTEQEVQNLRALFDSYLG